MIKILQINSVVNTGSTGRIAEDIGNRVLSKKWESHIAYGRYANQSSSRLKNIGDKFSNYYHVYLTRVFDKHGLGSTSGTKKLISYIDDLSPDVVHLHNIHGYYLNYKLLFSYLSEKSTPTVWTLHDCWSFTGHCVHFESINCTKWMVSCNKCPQKTSYPSSYLFDRSEKNFNDKKKSFNSSNLTIVPVSHWLENLVKKSFLSKNKIQVIQNGIDLNIFKPIKNSNLKKLLGVENKFIILCVASIWNEGKGFKDIIEISQKIDRDEIIIIVGLNKKQLNSIPNNIIGVEKTGNIKELAEFYSESDVFLNPTYADTFPTTNLESLACGTPIVTYDTGGSPEAISKETGYVVDQGDKKGLLRALKKIKAKGKNYFMNACIKRARDNFNKEDRYNDYIELYNNLIQRNKSNV
ncbi:glycosyltransferase [Maribacter sp. 2210JD10-5]|uniref:glycosyltransferase n=1 Tax=Maribacter sp. 2210JD10-5 TaxID=3386272 RepID=UPI0039BD4699